MLLSSWQERIARILFELKANVKSPVQFWLLVRMLIWWYGLRILRPFLPVQRMVWFASPAGDREKLSTTDVLNCLRLLDRLRLWNSNGACLPRALVTQRFLTIAGLEPVLFIGFSQEGGHAWVELNGVPLLDPQVASRHYQPMLIFEHRDKVVRNISGTS